MKCDDEIKKETVEVSILLTENLMKGDIKQAARWMILLNNNVDTLLKRKRMADDIKYKIGKTI